jgi:5-amino-6-(5-phosphoribosylamino)uracil reductase
MTRPYVVLSVAASLDGCIDDSGPERLLLSNEKDFDRVDELRAGVDAILVGAGTVRADDPRLLVRSQERRRRRAAEGKTASPLRVVLSSSGELDPAARVFSGDAETLVDQRDVHDVLTDLHARGVARLLVEGGSGVFTTFLTERLADELHLVLAPFFLGDPDAPRVVTPTPFPRTDLHLAETRQMGDAVLLRYVIRD